VVLAGGVAAAAVIDLRTRRIPNVLTAAMAVAGIAFAAAGVGAITPTAAVAGLVVGGLLMLPGHALGATGSGDVKLMAAVGALLGPAAVVSASWPRRRARRRRSRRRSAPIGLRTGRRSRLAVWSQY
jgi:prepilin peptidase CpaA